MCRESWLERATAALRVDYIQLGYPLPEKLRVSCGWPSSRALSTKKRTIGEAWSAACSADGSAEVLISPYLDDPITVLATLVHELAHTATPGQGHKGAFRTLACRLGLEGKLTATHAGAALTERLNALAKRLGPYPHAKLDYSKERKKQPTRLRKMMCGQCGFIVRTTDKWLALMDDNGVTLDCPFCRVHMEKQ